MLDMGFKPQVDKIVRRLPANRQTMFFSATLDGEVGELARRYTQYPGALRRRAAGGQPERARSTTSSSRSRPTTRCRRSSTCFRATTRARARLRPDEGRRRPARAEAPPPRHRRGRDPRRQGAGPARARAERFDSGKVRTLVATDVAARGLDVDGITHVINFDPPGEPDAYTHRVGRTGRAGRGGTGITLVLPEQQADVSRVARLKGHTEQFEAAGHDDGAPEARVHVTPRPPLEVVDERLHGEAGGGAAARARGARGAAPHRGRRRDQEGARVRRPLRELRVPRREERAGPPRGEDPHAARAARPVGDRRGGDRRRGRHRLGRRGRGRRRRDDHGRDQRPRRHRAPCRRPHRSARRCSAARWARRSRSPRREARGKPRSARSAECVGLDSARDRVRRSRRRGFGVAAVERADRELWVLTGLNGKAPLAGTSITAEFTSAKAVSGSAGCNRYSGTFRTVGRTIRISSLASTEMACPAEDHDPGKRRI